MDIITQILIATFASITGLFESIAAELGCFGGIAKEVNKDGSVMINVAFHTSLWAAGDKAWRIEALADLVADYHDGRVAHQSFTTSGASYRNVSGSYLCKTPKEQRQCLEALALICTRTSPRIEA